MIRLNIITEGKTEETFVNQIITPYLTQSYVFATPRLIRTGSKRGHIYRGGMTTYSKAKWDIQQWIKQEKSKEVRFTTMFDLYALPNDFPKFDESKKINKPYERVQFLEESLMSDIQDYRFIPYIQLYEFEALLLSEPEKFKERFIGDKYEISIKRLKEMVKDFKSPELINDGEETAPSKRIISIIPEYKKSEAGSMIAQEIGLETIRTKCPHFNEWINKLETLGGVIK